jgi:hypothetical protein
VRSFQFHQAVATIGTGLSSGCRKLGITPCSRAGTTSHRQFSINRAQKRDRHRQIAERLLDNCVLGQQVRLAGLRSDGGEINHSRRTRRIQRCPNL